MLYSIYHVLMEGGGGGGSGGISKEEDQAIAKFRTCPKDGVSLRNISNNKYPPWSTFTGTDEFYQVYQLRSTET